jgi:intracellular sulfur oxidation DsrE/DsrF family protein
MMLICVAGALAPSIEAQVRPKTGPVVESAGPVFDVPKPTFVTPTDFTYKVAFEVANKSSEPDRMNQQLVTIARFLNVHAQAGVPGSQVGAAAVVHGTAGKDLLLDEAYRDAFGTANPNTALIRELTEAGVQIVLCGQTAAARGIDRGDLQPGVKVALSAMTALFVFQEQGYRINPW